MVKFRVIEDAFDYVSSGIMGENSAVISKDTGEAFFHSEYDDLEDEYPEDAHDEEKYINIPHKNDLGLGRDLVFRFASQFLPGSVDQIYDFFRMQGAYRRYKQFLVDRGMLDQWHEYEHERERIALREWCEMEDIEFEE